MASEFEEDDSLLQPESSKKQFSNIQETTPPIKKALAFVGSHRWMCLFLLLLSLTSIWSWNNYVKQQKNLIAQNMPHIIAAKIQAIQSRIVNASPSRLSAKNISNLHDISTRKVTSQQKFIVPRQLWLYIDEEATIPFILKKAQQNIERYAKESKFELKVISKGNYSKWLSAQAKNNIEKQIAMLEGKNSPYKSAYILETLVKLSLAKEYGGVFIDRNYILTEKLDWLEDLKQNIHINTGNDYAVPKCFTFFSIMDGIPPQKENKQADCQADKKIIKFPAISESLWAVIPHSDYFQDLLIQYFNVLENIHQLSRLVEEAGLESNALKIEYPHTLLSLASVTVLQKKQKLLDEQGILYLEKYSKFAIDQYGLFTINSNYFPDKMEYYFIHKYHLYDNFFNYLAKMSLEEFEDSIGPLRYLAKIDPFGQFNARLQSARDQKGEYQLWMDSFLQRYLFWEGKQHYIKRKPSYLLSSKPFKKWDSLLKTIWIYWNAGLKNAPMITQLCILNIRKSAQAAGFNVEEVNDNNLDQYLPSQDLEKIHHTYRYAKMPIYDQTKSDFIRLALVSRYGGIYLDASYFFLQDLSWITDIAKEPTKYIFNRFGDVPKVLMQFHPIEGGLLDWQWHPTEDTRIQWHFGVESNFIAADPNNQFVKEWFDMMINFTLSTFNETVAKMFECGCGKFIWNTEEDRYLTVMDSLKAVLGCRQKDIDMNPSKYGEIRHANDYYKLWVFNGFTGVQKFRHYNNYANPYRINKKSEYNYLLFEKSEDYVLGVYGPMYKAIKIYGIRDSILKYFVLRNWKSGFTEEAHPQSFFMKYLHDPKYQYFQYRTEFLLYQYFQIHQLHVRET